MASRSWWTACLVLVASAAAGDLARVFKSGDETLVELSRDGQWILTRSFRRSRCADGSSGCRLDRLAVYDLGTGSLVGELVSKPSANGSDGFGPAGFVRGRSVAAVEYDGWDPQSDQVAQNVVEWDPVEGVPRRSPLPPAGQFSPLCPVDSGKFIGINTAGNSRRPAERQWLPGIADRPASDSGCSTRRLGGEVLIEQRRFGEKLVWSPSALNDPPRLCREFPGERIHGYAVSPDGSLIAVVTTPRGKPFNGLLLPESRAVLHVLSGAQCTAVKQLELSFPDDPHPALYAGDFARHVAISPDLSKVAVAYGVRSRMDGLAFFGIYSLDDGRRLATFKGDAYRGGYWMSRRTLDIAAASMAPLEGGLEFSADSRSLYATSRYLRQWDVSGLR